MRTHRPKAEHLDFKGDAVASSGEEALDASTLAAAADGQSSLDDLSPTRAEKILQLLREVGRRHGQLVHEHHIPARQGISRDWPDWIHPQVIQAWAGRGIQKPWQHQVSALDALHRGENCVIATGTGSGKSLPAWTPILSDILEAGSSSRISELRRRPTTVYISPTKALTADQFAGLRALIDSADLPVRAATADGDTPREAKEWARANADIILTNPDFLHFVMLPAHERWVRFLSSLRYIIVDELHYWRGVTGSHISLVLRRLLRVARRLGADPQVVCLSATVRDPQAVAEAMIGRGVTAIDQDTSPAGDRYVLLWRPREIVDTSAVDIDAFLGALAGEIPVLEAPTVRLSAATEASMLLSDIVAAGGRALAFVRSRAGTEAVAAQVRERLSASGNPLAGRVGAYRGGYLPEERRALEAALRSGDIRAVATTSALEMGIDVSGLDVTVTAGWPGTRASLWQQIGRAGRAGSMGVSVLVASDDPLDAYIVEHPEHIVQPVESATIDPFNPWVLAPHVAAAAAEWPIGAGDEEFFGSGVGTVLQRLSTQGLVRERRVGGSCPVRDFEGAGVLPPGVEWRWDFTRPERAVDLTDLRGSGGDVQIIDAASGVVIGSVPDADADAQVFPDAIYVHQGVTYHVLSLSLVSPGSPQRVAEVERVSTRLRTRAKSRTHVRIIHSEASCTSSDGCVTWHFGTVEVTSQVTDFDLLRLPGPEFLRNQELDLPQRSLSTKAVWFTVDPVALKRLGIAVADVPGALHAAEHAAIGLLPLLATCDRWDLGGLSCAEHEQTLLPTVFVYDAYRGGAGHAQCGFDRAIEWMTLTYQTVMGCVCDDGCPSCIQSPKCGNGNEPLVKSGAKRLLDYLSCLMMPHDD